MYLPLCICDVLKVDLQGVYFTHMVWSAKADPLMADCHCHLYLHKVVQESMLKQKLSMKLLSKAFETFFH